MAAVVVVQDGCDSLALLHTFLYPVVRPDALAHQRGGQGRLMDCAFRDGKDLLVWRPDDTRS